MEISYVFNLLISIAALVVVLMIPQWKKRIVWWEASLIVVLPTLFSILTGLLLSNIASSSTEYWTEPLVELHHDEPWNEWVVKQCPKQVSDGTERYRSGTDSKGNATYSTRTKYKTIYVDCPEQVNHCADWWGKTSSGKYVSLSESEYKTFLRINNNSRMITATHINHSKNDYACGGSYSNTTYGYKSYSYITKCLQDFDKLIPITSTHIYENKVKNTDYSALGYEKVDTSEVSIYELIDYPELKSPFYHPVIVGKQEVSVYLQKIFNQVNCEIGSKKQCKLFICTFVGQPIQAAITQESYWVGGNKNEIVICLGFDKEENLTWVHPFSWSFQKSGTLEADIRHIFDKHNNGYINTSEWKDIAYQLKDVILEKFDRLQFTDENEGFNYLSVEPPTWAIITNIIISLIICVLVIKYSITNDINQ